MKKGDRLYAEPSISPVLEIKTNLDKDDVEENPYYKSSMNRQEAEKFKEYFYEEDQKGDSSE